jgi:hypothetical protein
MLDFSSIVDFCLGCRDNSVRRGLAAVVVARFGWV